MRTLVRDAVLFEGGRADVLLDDDRVLAVDGAADHVSVDEVVEAGGRLLLPGLHDHHLHLLAMAAAARSVDCGPAAVSGSAELGAALAAGPTDAEGWVRGTGYHESVAGDLDRDRLDAMVGDRPVRVQHRSGALWVLSSGGLARLGPLPETTDVERDADGRPNGRLWRLDPWLAGQLRAAGPPDLAGVGEQLHRHGITSATDATPELDAAAVGLLRVAVGRGELPPLHLLTRCGFAEAPGLTRGPLKLLLHDHDLPDFDTLAGWVQAAHDAGRPVAVHVVTRISLVLTLAVLEAVGVRPGDRLEHAAVVPPELVPGLARLGLRVVTQPGFLRERGEDYLRDVDPGDQPFLYPHACLLEAGVRVAASSDAPYGPVNPWEVLAAAADRRSRAGRPVGGDRPLPVLDALAGYLTPADDPGGPVRRVVPGARADLVLLEVGPEGLADAGPDPVRRVWRGRP